MLVLSVPNVVAECAKCNSGAVLKVRRSRSPVLIKQKCRVRCY